MSPFKDYFEFRQSGEGVRTPVGLLFLCLSQLGLIHTYSSPFHPSEKWSTVHCFSGFDRHYGGNMLVAGWLRRSTIHLNGLCLTVIPHAIHSMLSTCSLDQFLHFNHVKKLYFLLINITLNPQTLYILWKQRPWRIKRWLCCHTIFA